MDRHWMRGWMRKLAWVIATTSAILCAGRVKNTEAAPKETTFQDYATASPANWRDSNNEPVACPSATKSEFLLLVSTLDGSLSAMDMRDKGELLWSMKVDERPLLSSSITNIQVTKNGIPIRLIPSLDGGLYEFDGEKVKAMPMTAESLLSSSVRLTDNSVIVGGKEVGSYGVDAKTGQMAYRCNSDGCHETDEANDGSGDLLVITHNTQTVRAVDANMGTEKWNFSVGQHSLAFVASKKEKPGLGNTESPAGSKDTDSESCTHEGQADFDSEDQLKRLVKVSVSDGAVIGLNPENPSEMAWSRKFGSPIAKAWILHRAKLEDMSLFDSNIVPALSNLHDSDQFAAKDVPETLLYVGTHKRQLYVQEQKRTTDSCENEMPWMMDPEVAAAAGAVVTHPQVTWRPYLNNAGYQTPIFGGNTPPETPLLESHESEDGEDLDTSLSVWHEKYPFDTGYYLYPHYTCDQPDAQWQVPAVEESIMDVLPASLWIWWKEVVAISLLTSLLVNILLARMLRRPRLVESDSQSMEKSQSYDSLHSSGDSLPVLAEEKPVAAEFKSRFADEFECMERLGKGGYGIVFKARNKVDEQEYAVKRIAVPNSDGTMKKKMLREVRTLAMLDHVGIVRYFHSWIEDPPPGWQEDKDKHWNDGTQSGDCLSPTMDTSALSDDKNQSSHTTPPPSPVSPLSRLRKPPSLLADILPNMDADLDFERHFFPKSASGSGEFSLHSNVEVATDESGSFSLDGAEDNGDSESRGRGCQDGEDSLSVVFQRSDPESSASGGASELSRSGDPCLPFKRYGGGGSSGRKCQMCSRPLEDCGCDNSSSVVFEDSRSRRDLQDENSSSVVFEDSKSRRGVEDENSSSVVFEDSRSRRDLGDDHSSSVVFEDSRSQAERVGSHALRRSQSPHCTDSSYGGSLDSNDNSDNTNDHCAVEFTLSSHGLSQRSIGEEKVEEGERDREGAGRRGGVKTVRPKLFLYLQMQLCRQETLKDWLMANTLNRERPFTLDIFEQIVSAVAYVHTKGLIHRDLKPSNIFFALDGIVKVGDFGLVTAPETQPEPSSETARNMTSSKHTADVGTQLYMSPEQVRKKAYDQKVDIFSLGLILLELLMPFSTGMERVTTLQNARKGNFPERFCRELPIESELVRRLMSADPEDRPTANQVLEHSLLQDFFPRRNAFRFRTISGSSSHSDHLSSPDFL